MALLKNETYFIFRFRPKPSIRFLAKFDSSHLEILDLKNLRQFPSL